MSDAIVLVREIKLMLLEIKHALEKEAKGTQEETRLKTSP